MGILPPKFHNSDLTKPPHFLELLGIFSSSVFDTLKLLHIQAPLEFRRRLLNKLGDSGTNSGFPESPLAYDAVWALAIAINSTIVELKRLGRNIAEELKAVADVTVISERAFKLMKSYLDKTDFIGVSVS